MWVGICGVRATVHHSDASNLLWIPPIYLDLAVDWVLRGQGHGSPLRCLDLAVDWVLRVRATVHHSDAWTSM